MIEKVYALPMKEFIKFERKERTDFKNFLSYNEIGQLLELYSDGEIEEIYNGTAVRLDVVTVNSHNYTLSISKVEFFDFLTTNMIYYKYDTLYEKAKNNRDALKVLAKVRDRIFSANNPNSFNNIIKNKYLANIIAVSILVEDSEANVGLVKRKKGMALGAGTLSVTVTGSMDEVDFLSKNPIMSCVKREIKEELNLIGQDIKCQNIIISKDKLQPIFLVNCKINRRFKDIITVMQSADDYNKEIASFYSVPKTEVISFILNEDMTSAARFHVFNTYSTENDKLEPIYLKDNYIVNDEGGYTSHW